MAALYEWCGKRHQTPTFTLQQPSDEFDCAVYLNREDVIDGDDKDVLQEWGRGRGRNKIAAKQEAARRALQALFPGVVFDEETGILVALPAEAENDSKTACRLDELAPTLEKQLAIGRNDYSEHSKRRNTVSRLYAQPKRSLGVYPETSTTSEEEDQSTYYASRGASVCSVLLHTIIQIDSSRIPEAPTFTYVVATLSSTSSSRSATTESDSSAQAKRNVGPGKPSVARAFTCTGQLKILTSAVARKPHCEGASDDVTDDCQTTTELLEAVGVGGTKREARHVASAKLLALLFPECRDMAEVKAAAEAMREQYAASKAQKQHASNSFLRHYRAHCLGDDAKASQTIVPGGRPLFALAQTDDPPLPLKIEGGLRSLFDRPTAEAQQVPLLEDVADEDLISSVNAVALTENLGKTSASAFRQLSRQKQVDSLVESALLCLNERDEDGRSVVPGELTADDVGRTVLRRAEPEDLPWIKKLFRSKEDKRSRAASFGADSCLSARSGIAAKDHQKQCSAALTESSPLAASDTNADNCSYYTSSDLVSRLWSSSSIVLLLCRAIAAYEDPPLGCAVLTLGFSMEEGRILRLAEIASEPHLPPERLVECLQKFASCMRCGFMAEKVTSPLSVGLRLSTMDFVTIVKSHVTTSDAKPSAVANIKTSGLAEGFTTGLSQLQSVQEESEVSEDSSSIDMVSPKQRAAIKPSKRSRFE